jgi:hypothetical protein
MERDSMGFDALIVGGGSVNFGSNRVQPCGDIRGVWAASRQ